MREQPALPAAIEAISPSARQAELAVTPARSTTQWPAQLHRPLPRQHHRRDDEEQDRHRHFQPLHRCGGAEAHPGPGSSCTPRNRPRLASAGSSCRGIVNDGASRGGHADHERARPPPPHAADAAPGVQTPDLDDAAADPEQRRYVARDDDATMATAVASHDYVTSQGSFLLVVPPAQDARIRGRIEDDVAAPQPRQHDDRDEDRERRRTASGGTDCPISCAVTPPRKLPPAVATSSSMPSFMLISCLPARLADTVLDVAMDRRETDRGRCAERKPERQVRKGTRKTPPPRPSSAPSAPDAAPAVKMISASVAVTTGIRECESLKYEV